MEPSINRAEHANQNIHVSLSLKMGEEDISRMVITPNAVVITERDPKIAANNPMSVLLYLLYNSPVL
jgi:hypothetical protein